MSAALIAASAGVLAASAASAGPSEPMDQSQAILILAWLVVSLVGGAVKAWMFPSWWSGRGGDFVAGSLGTFCVLGGLMLLIMLVGTALGY